MAPPLRASHKMDSETATALIGGTAAGGFGGFMAKTWIGHVIKSRERKIDSIPKIQTAIELLRKDVQHIAERLSDLSRRLETVERMANNSQSAIRLVDQRLSSLEAVNHEAHGRMWEGIKGLQKKNEDG